MNCSEFRYFWFAVPLRCGKSRDIESNRKCLWMAARHHDIERNISCWRAAFCAILLGVPILKGAGSSNSRLGLSADSSAARGLHSGHRGNFGKPIQEGVPWDAAKPEGHSGPQQKCQHLPECDCHLPTMESAGRRARRMTQCKRRMKGIDP